MLRAQCNAYKKIDFSDPSLRRDLDRDSRFLNQEQYLSAAFGHRFCLAAPGDFLSASPKITEFIAVGAAGGCIPVLIVPRDALTILPHGQWLDYCQFAFLVRQTVSRPADMRAVLARLENVTAAEAAVKHLALRRVRDAFVWRDRSDNAPSAADYALRAACQFARRWKERKSGLTAGPEAYRSKMVDGGAAGMLSVGGKCVLA